MKDFVGFFLYFIAGLTLVVFGLGVLLLMGNEIDKYECKKYQEVTGNTTKHAGLTCYIKDGGKWLRFAEYKNRGED